MRVRVVAPTRFGGVLECVEWLTPYAVETIVEHTLRAGPSARLEVTVAESGGDAGFRHTQRQFGWLRGRGVAVDVQRDSGWRVDRGG